MATAYLSSGIIALMFGLAPIITGLIGHFVFRMHLHRLQWLGMCIAVCGLGIICMGGSGQHVHPIGIVLMLMSVLIYLCIYILGKKSQCALKPIAQATGSILISAPLHYVWCLLFGNMYRLRCLLLSQCWPCCMP